MLTNETNTNFHVLLKITAHSIIEVDLVSNHRVVSKTHRNYSVLDPTDYQLKILNTPWLSNSSKDINNLADR